MKILLLFLIGNELVALLSELAMLLLLLPEDNSVHSLVYVFKILRGCISIGDNAGEKTGHGEKLYGVAQ